MSYIRYVTYLMKPAEIEKPSIEIFQGWRASAKGCNSKYWESWVAANNEIPLLSSHHHHLHFPPFNLRNILLTAASCSQLSPVLLTERQIKKGKPIIHLRPSGKLPSTTKGPSSQFPNNPLHRRTSPCRSANEHGSLKKQSPLQWFTPLLIRSIHPSLFFCHAHSLPLY